MEHKTEYTEWKIDRIHRMEHKTEYTEWNIDRINRTEHKTEYTDGTWYINAKAK
jgi:hypothetical protein